MQRILFRDEPFYVKIIINKAYVMIGSSIKVYIKREGLFKLFKPYKLLVNKTNISRRAARSEQTLIDALDEAYRKTRSGKERTICIQCSPAIADLYEKL